MALTKIRTSIDVKVDQDLDMNGNKAKNMHNGEQIKDAITKEQLEATAEELSEQSNWKATQW